LYHLEEATLEQLRTRRSVKWSRYSDCLYGSPAELEGGVRAGAGLLPAWIADMDFAIARPIRAALAEAIAKSDLGYPSGSMLDGVCCAYSSWAGVRDGVPIDPDLVLPIRDVTYGIEVGLRELSDPARAVAVLTPSYPGFFEAIERAGNTVVGIPLHRGVGPSGGYGFDPEEMMSTCRRERVGTLLLCNPHNPTGRAFSRSELVEIGKLAEVLDLTVISDEIHADLTPPGGVFTATRCGSPELARRTITVSAASKTFGITGLRCAVVHFPDALMKARFIRISEREMGGLSSLGLLGTTVAWREGRPWLQAVRRVLADNVALLSTFLRERLPGIVFYPPEATYLAWLDLAAYSLLEEPAAFLVRAAGVVCSSGREFGPGGSDHVRLNFATSKSILTEIVERMATALEHFGTPPAVKARR